jgi:enoyl-CoA hydratase
MAFETVLIEHRDGVRYITLNRPNALNALNFQLIDDLLASI